MPFAVFYSPSCEQKAQMLAECDRCKVDLGRARATLKRYEDLLSREEVANIQAFAAKLQAECQRIQELLAKHECDHGCRG